MQVPEQHAYESHRPSATPANPRVILPRGKHEGPGKEPRVYPLCRLKGVGIALRKQASQAVGSSAAN